MLGLLGVICGCVDQHVYSHAMCHMTLILMVGTAAYTYDTACGFKPGIHAVSKVFRCIWAACSMPYWLGQHHPGRLSTSTVRAMLLVASLAYGG